MHSCVCVKKIFHKIIVSDLLSSLFFPLLKGLAGVPAQDSGTIRLFPFIGGQPDLNLSHPDCTVMEPVVRVHLFRKKHHSLPAGYSPAPCFIFSLVAGVFPCAELLIPFASFILFCAAKSRLSVRTSGRSYQKCAGDLFHQALRMIGHIADADIFNCSSGCCKPSGICKVDHTKNLLSHLIVITISYWRRHVKLFFYSN